jgi:uncharacterized protein YqeY
MSLKEKIQQDLTTSLKEKKELELSVLRMLNAAIVNKEKTKRYKISKEKPDLNESGLEKESGLSDEEVMEVISSEVKKRNEAALEFEKGKRQELAEKEKKEAKILEQYLPEQLPEEEIMKMAKEAVEKTAAKEMKDMGRVMAELMPRVKGRADGGLISKIVKELLGQ